MGLRNYVLRRVAQLLLTYWSFITILFVVFRLMPGDPTSMYVLSGLPAEEQQAMISRLGLDQPLHVQYVEYMGQLLTGDFGRSFIYREPVIDILTIRFWNTVLLMGTALTIAYLIGVGGGALLGWWRGSAFEKGGVVATLIARSSPDFWIGIVLLSIFVFWLDLLPAGGMRTATAEIQSFADRYLSWDFVYHMVLPVMTGAIYFASTPTLLMRNTILEVLDTDFIEVKRAEGLSEGIVLYRHAVRNSVLPLVTIAAISVGTAMGGSIVIETVFNWPGMGREMVQSVHNNDYPLAMATFFVMGSVVILMNFVADLLYVYLDPRVEYE